MTTSANTYQNRVTALLLAAENTQTLNAFIHLLAIGLSWSRLMLEVNFPHGSK